MARVHDDGRRYQLRSQDPAPVAARSRDRAAPHGPTLLAALGAQASLLVGAVDDPAEREADDIARLVLSRLSTRAQGDGEDVRREPAAPLTRIRRSAIGPAGGPVDHDTSRAIDAARGHGAPIQASMRRSMEGAFGADFSGVRVHTDRRSTDLNERLQARAFTLGSDIFVHKPADLSGSSGAHLLAHELTHVVQQSG